GGGELVEPAVGALVEQREGGEPGGGGQRVSREGARLVHRPLPRHLRHQLGGAAVGGGGETAADHLAEGDQVGVEAVQAGGTRPVHPEAGQDLVEDQQRASPASLLAQGGQEPGGRRHHPHVGRDRLDQDRGDLAASQRERGGERGLVVVGGDQRVRRLRRGHARGVGPAGGGH